MVNLHPCCGNWLERTSHERAFPIRRLPAAPRIPSLLQVLLPALTKAATTGYDSLTERALAAIIVDGPHSPRDNHLTTPQEVEKHPQMTEENLISIIKRHRLVKLAFPFRKES